MAETQEQAFAGTVRSQHHRLGLGLNDTGDVIDEVLPCDLKTDLVLGPEETSPAWSARGLHDHSIAPLFPLPIGTLGHVPYRQGRGIQHEREEQQNDPESEC